MANRSLNLSISSWSEPFLCHDDRHSRSSSLRQSGGSVPLGDHAAEKARCLGQPSPTVRIVRFFSVPFFPTLAAVDYVLGCDGYPCVGSPSGRDRVHLDALSGVYRVRLETAEADVADQDPPKVVLRM